MYDEKEYLRQEYKSRINRVIDYISGHLSDEIDLDHLADIACFSRFHFHRIFKAFLGETMSAYIKRIRLERSVGYLTGNPRMTITEIAFECGFSGSAAYARAFKERFGMSASEFRRAYFLCDIPESELDSKQCKTVSKYRKAVSKGWKANNDLPDYIMDVTKKPNGRFVMKMEKVEVKQLPEMYVAYARHIGPYNGIGEAFERIGKWAGARGVMSNPDTKFLGVYHDNPEVTEPEKLRSDACVTVPKDTTVDGDIGYTTIPAGLYAMARFEIAHDEFTAAWDKFMKEWFPESGYQPDDRPCFELYLNNHEDHPEKHFILDICEPVKPL